MGIEELIKALGLDEANAAVLRKFVAEKDGEILKKTTDLTVLKAKNKGDSSKVKELEQKLEAVYDTLGIDEDTEDIEEAIESALKGKSNDPALQKQINKLKTKIADQEKDFNAKFTEERNKRFDNMKRSALLEALSANDADDPNLLVDMLLNKIVVNEDDESMTFNDDKNSKIGDYVKEFLTAHPKLVTNNQNSGAGSLFNGSAKGGKSEETDFAKKLAESNNANSESATKALESYFA